MAHSAYPADTVTQREWRGLVGVASATMTPDGRHRLDETPADLGVSSKQ